MSSDTELSPPVKRCEECGRFWFVVYKEESLGIGQWTCQDGCRRCRECDGYVYRHCNSCNWKNP